MNILLLTVPFHEPQVPSIALTQLKGRLLELFRDHINVEILYLNHDFWGFFGKETYSFIMNKATLNGLNDWIFRQEAFDNVRDNQDVYFKRFFQGPQNKEITDILKQKKECLGAFIEELIDTYKIDSYDLVGINATFSIVPGLAFFKHIKKRNARCITLMGGSGVKENMGEALMKYFPHVDYICSGYGLVAFPNFVNNIIKKNPPEALNQIDGIFSKTNIGTVKRNGASLDINHMIPLDYNDFLNSYAQLGLDRKPTLLLETSRGCPWGKCKFCGLNENMKKYEAKSPEVAINEITETIKQYDLDIGMVDNVMPRTYLKTVLPHLKLPENRSILYEVRADLKYDEVKTLREANIRYVQPGIESVSTPILKRMNKGITGLDTINFLRLCSEHLIVPYWNIIIGFPGMSGEMYQDLMEKIPLLVHLIPPVTLTPVRFDRFSVYWKDPSQYGLNLVPSSIYSYIYPYDNDFLSNIAYYFDDSNYSTIEVMATFHGKLAMLVKQWKARWYAEEIGPESLPKLYRFCKDGDAFIYDTRQGDKCEHQLTSLEDKILTTLKHPMNIDGIQTAIPDDQLNNLEAALSNLKNKYLILEEEGRYVCLVITNDTSEQLKQLKYLMEK